MAQFHLYFAFEQDTDGVDKAVALLQLAEKAGLVLTSQGSGPGPDGPPPQNPPRKPIPATSVKSDGKNKTASSPSNSSNKTKAAKPVPPPVKEQDLADLLDVAGENDDDDDDGGGLGLADDSDDAGFTGTAEEAKEEALARLRTMMANGHKAHIKEVQQIMKVAKFHDIPPERGFDFLKQVKAVQKKIGLG